jgi:hypothetical protein
MPRMKSADFMEAIESVIFIVRNLTKSLFLRIEQYN